ncbi:hypothetical protein PVAP13_4KG061500 [Panicum virgatum]|uniref:Uncharacterized protein n=1 Tax=Panicum virgatum TaxID=38727 RepID=A0A8T0TD15_PANVG|nr:hypothetical protein PVAP13_4KG061500 [Panicum virgatum]KAG2609693.1 hypothetical protein PVAP13_4KG061500 [Panicum virgatum]KAG2609694.1 hypothetical protein PVAP13_4KG061500 [Panicum virgatum]
MIRLPGIPALLHLIGQGLKHREEDDMENCSYVIRRCASFMGQIMFCRPEMQRFVHLFICSSITLFSILFRKYIFTVIKNFWLDRFNLDSLFYVEVPCSKILWCNLYIEISRCIFRVPDI